MTATARLDGKGLSALVRPRILVLVAAETAAGFLLARPEGLGALPFLLVGTVLVSAAGCALNHLIEREADARMERTRLRPLVTGALRPAQVLVGGIVALVLGLALIAWRCGPLPAGIEAIAAGIYLGIYTPLKRRTSTNTWVGAIPGALPVLAGAAAVRGEVGLLPLIVFGLIALWQLPHFFAIASMYREQYREGGMRMLSGDDPDDELARWQIPLLVMCVVLVSVLPVAAGLARAPYGIVALLLGGVFLWSAWQFRARPERGRARSVVVVSVAYLPLLLLALVADVSYGRPPMTPGGLPVYAAVPDFSLTDERGEVFTQADMDGETWVVDFFFTRCNGICLPMSEGFAALQAEGLGARFLSVTIDPVHDQPEALRAYRERLGGDAEAWRLATGTHAAIESLASAGFRLPAATRKGDALPVEGTPEMFHSGKYALVDGRGRVRGFYDHDDVLDLADLRRDVEALALEEPELEDPSKVGPGPTDGHGSDGHGTDGP